MQVLSSTRQYVDNMTADGAPMFHEGHRRQVVPGDIILKSRQTQSGQSHNFEIELQGEAPRQGNVYLVSPSKQYRVRTINIAV